MEESVAEHERASGFSVLKSVVAISMAFMLQFTAFNSMSALQSSINREYGLGTYSVSVIYISAIVSAMFVPSPVIQKVGTKWTIVLSMLGYSAYITAQFFPAFITLMPAAAIVGLCAAPLWNAKCTYLSKAARYYARLQNKQPEETIPQLFGVFFLIYQASTIWGSIISSSVLGSGSDTKNISSLTRGEMAKCGVNYCSYETTSLLQTLDNYTAVPLFQGPPDMEDTPNKRNGNFETDHEIRLILIGVYLAISLVAPAIVFLLVDSSTKFQLSEEEKSKMSGCNLVLATWENLRDPNQILLVPISIWPGLEQGFLGADFTAGYVTCVYGVQNVGLVFITFGICDALFCFVSGRANSHTGRMPIVIFGAIINFIVIAVLFSWDPKPDQRYLFFILTGLWGMADAVWQTQISSMYGALFKEKEEAGFSNMSLWRSIGFASAYGVQDVLCVSTKMWILVGCLGLGMAGYMMVEVREAKRKRGESSA